MAHTKARRHKEDGKNQLFGFCDVALDTEPSIKSLPYLCAFVPLCEDLSAGAYAPRIRETSGNDKSFVARNSRGPFFSSSTVIAPSNVNRPDFVRRKAAR